MFLDVILKSKCGVVHDHLYHRGAEPQRALKVGEMVADTPVASEPEHPAPGADGELRAERRRKRPAERARRSQRVAPRLFLVEQSGRPHRHVAGIGDNNVITADVIVQCGEDGVGTQAAVSHATAGQRRQLLSPGGNIGLNLAAPVGPTSDGVG